MIIIHIIQSYYFSSLSCINCLLNKICDKWKNSVRVTVNVFALFVCVPP